MRAGLRMLVDGVDEIRVVGEATDGATAIDQARALDPDVVLMDVRMPGCDGLEATRRLQNEGIRARVIVLTAFDTDGYVLEALRSGAVSFLLKDAQPAEVIAAIKGAVGGSPQFSAPVLTRLVTWAIEADRSLTPDSSVPSVPSVPAVPVGITPREWEVGEFVAQGLTNSEIAEAMYLSTTTVKTHLGRLFDKLHVTNRVQLAIRVLEHST
ncbi:response regulator transcription factor [Ruania alkalisoli]|uniref:Response regulator transcription factor n=2 Tax=Ruania alkalisoli TaxID=2779775 RepID=A0A7M1SYE3_9MICO|nr:response regulator transcription factor [Ruania alkalisoli]